MGVSTPFIRAATFDPVIMVNRDGTPNDGALLTATDRSGTATTTSGGLNVAANASRRGLTGQNVGANNIGFNELGGVAAIGSPGTYTVTPGSTFRISTPNLINFIAATGNTAVTMTEW